MGRHEDRFAAAQPLQCLQDMLFVFRIKAGGDFIEQQYRCIAPDGACQSQAASLAGAQGALALAELRIEALRQGSKPVAQAGCLQCGLQGGIRGFSASQRDVFPKGGLEDMGLLGDEGQMAQPVPVGNLLRGRPPMVMLPAVGASWRSSSASTVDLPAPLGPVSRVMLAAFAWKDRPRSTSSDWPG